MWLTRRADAMRCLELNQAREFVASVIIVIPKVVRSLVALFPLQKTTGLDTENRRRINGVEHRIVFGNVDGFGGLQPPETGWDLGDPGRDDDWFLYGLSGMWFA